MQNKMKFKKYTNPLWRPSLWTVFMLILLGFGCGTQSHSPQAEAIAIQEKEFEKILSSQEPELDRCFYQLKKKNEKRILVFLQYEIQKNGLINHVMVEKNGVFTQVATQCAANVLQRLQMPRPLMGVAQLKRIYRFGSTIQKPSANLIAMKHPKKKQLTIDHAQDLATLNSQLKVYEKWDGNTAHYNDLLDWAKAYEGEFKHLNEILTQIVPLLYIAKYRQVQKNELQKWQDDTALSLKNYTNEFPLLVGEEPELELRQAKWGVLSAKAIAYVFDSSFKKQKKDAMLKMMIQETNRLFAAERLRFNRCQFVQRQARKELIRLKSLRKELEQKDFLIRFAEENAKYTRYPYRFELKEQNNEIYLQAIGREVEVKDDILRINSAWKVQHVFNACSGMRKMPKSDW